MVLSTNTYSMCEPPWGCVTSLLHFTFLIVFVFSPSGIHQTFDQKAWFSLSGTFQFFFIGRRGQAVGVAFVNYLGWSPPHFPAFSPVSVPVLSDWSFSCCDFHRISSYFPHFPGWFCLGLGWFSYRISPPCYIRVFICCFNGQGYLLLRPLPRVQWGVLEGLFPPLPGLAQWVCIGLDWPPREVPRITS